MEENKKGNNKAGMIMISDEENAKILLIADKITLLDSRVKLVDSKAYIELNVMLASSNVIELTSERDIKSILEYLCISKQITPEYSNSLVKSLIATTIADRFYDTLLKTETVGYRRTISWWNFVSKSIDEFKDLLLSGELDDHLEVVNV